jgi:hypothetical protein
VSRKTAVAEFQSATVLKFEEEPHENTFPSHALDHDDDKDDVIDGLFLFVDVPSDNPNIKI